MSTLMRRSKNRISSILNENGEWVHSTEDVKGIFVNYFKKLYKKEQVCSSLNLEWDNDWCATLSIEEANYIAHCSSDEEI